MRAGIKGGRGGTIYPMQKGETKNPNGRPRKIATQLKVAGYKMSQIKETLENIGVLNLTEIKEFMKNKDATVIELGVCKMFHDFIYKGKSDVLEYLLTKKNASSIDEETLFTDKAISDIGREGQSPIETSAQYQKIIS